MHKISRDLPAFVFIVDKQFERWKKKQRQNESSEAKYRKTNACCNDSPESVQFI